MSNLQSLIEQRAEIEAKIRQARKAEIAQGIAQAKAIIVKYELTERDLFAGRRGKLAGGSKMPVAPKYRDPDSGKTWTGRGKPPKWIEGRAREQFLIK